MTWSSSERHGTNWKPKGWVKLRARVFREQRDECATAGCHRRCVELDHVNGDRTDHRRENLQGLCGPHHRAKTQREAATSRQRAPRTRPPEQHPGRRVP